MHNIIQPTCFEPAVIVLSRNQPTNQSPCEV